MTPISQDLAGFNFDYDIDHLKNMNFISYSKCESITSGRYDNGRVIGADELEIVLTDIDLKFIFESYKFDSYEFIEVYWANKSYLPIEYINFILEKYENKTKYKNVERKRG